MPGVYVTHYGKNKKSAAATGTADRDESKASAAAAMAAAAAGDDDADFSQFSTEFLLAETQRLSAQMDAVRARTAEDTAELARLRARMAAELSGHSGAGAGHAATGSTRLPGSAASVSPAMPGFSPTEAVHQLEFQLRAAENDLRHLEQSQVTLRAALEAEPDDEVLQEGTHISGLIMLC